jgi:hypothetical protein
MENTKMTLEDINAVISAAENLDRVNRKYGCPYGTNPIGIVVHAYALLKQKNKEAVYGHNDKVH